MEQDSRERTLFDEIGGIDACHRLSATFYRRVAQDPVLKRFFSGSLRCATDALTEFLGQVLGGPNGYSRTRPWLSLYEAHQRFTLGQLERDSWLRNMIETLSDFEIDEPLRAALTEFFAQSSTDLVNSPSLDQAIECPSESSDKPLLHRWSIERTMAALCHTLAEQDVAGALALAESEIVREYIKTDRAAYANLLSVIGSVHNDTCLAYVAGHFKLDTTLASEHHAGGRTPLHDAAAAGNLPFVELLLSHRADPNAIDDAGHAPLYFAGNQGGTAEVVHAIARAGANVDACDGVKRCTALHMAARRDNVAVGEALLDCGANIEALDSKNESPLRRAVNCSQPAIAALLLARGANPHSIGSKGLTPLQAARGAAMRALMLRYV